MARELLGAGTLAAAAAMAVAGLDRMVLHTGMHPYFNQTWGYVVLPFALVLAWWTVRERSRGAGVLLLLALAVEGFAYPLALPIPLLALAGFAVGAPRAGGARAAAPARDRRALACGCPRAVLLGVPLAGVLVKMGSAFRVVADPSRSLHSLGRGPLRLRPHGPVLRAARRVGDVPLAAVIVLPRRWWRCAGASGRSRRAGRGVRLRPAGGPVVPPARLRLVLRVQGAGVHRAVGAGGGGGGRGPPAAACAAPIALLVLWPRPAPATSCGSPGPSPTGTALELRDWAAALPAGASVRLDVPPGGDQLWAGYFLSRQPLCSLGPC